MKKFKGILATLVFLGTTLTGGSHANSNIAENPETMVCRVAEAVVSDDEDDYVAIYPDSVNRMYANYESFHDTYALRCMKHGIDYSEDYSFEDTQILKTSDDGISASYYVYLEGVQMFRIETVYDTANKGYIIEEIKPTKAEDDSYSVFDKAKKSFEVVDTDNIDLY